MRLLPAVVAAVVALSLLPGSALAGSVTVTSPPDGATYSLAAGQSPTSGKVAVHLSAIRDRTGCPVAESGPSLFYYEQHKDNEANFGSVFQTVEDAIDGDRSYGVGTWQFRAGFRCTNDGPNGPNFYSSVVTIHVVPYGGATPTPGPTPDPGVKATCVKMQSLVQAMSRTNNHVRDDLIPSNKRATTTLGWLSKFGDWGGTAIAANPEIPGSPALAAAYKAEGKFAKGAQLWGTYVTFRAEQQVKASDAVIAAEVKAYEALCKGITVAAVGDGFVPVAWAPSALLPVRAGAAAKAPSPRTLLSRAKDNAKAQSKVAAGLNAALGRLNGHITIDGAPATDVDAVREQAGAAAKLMADDIAVRKALARNGALGRVRLRKSDVPKSLRRNATVRKTIGKPLAGLLVAKDEKVLLATLKALPALP